MSPTAAFVILASGAIAISAILWLFSSLQKARKRAESQRTLDENALRVSPRPTLALPAELVTAVLVTDLDQFAQWCTDSDADPRFYAPLTGDVYQQNEALSGRRVRDVVRLPGAHVDEQLGALLRAKAWEGVVHS